MYTWGFLAWWKIDYSKCRNFWGFLLKFHSRIHMMIFDMRKNRLLQMSKFLWVPFKIPLTYTHDDFWHEENWLLQMSKFLGVLFKIPLTCTHEDFWHDEKSITQMSKFKGFLLKLHYLYTWGFLTWGKIDYTKISNF